MDSKETEREIVAGIQLAHIRIQWTQQLASEFRHWGWWDFWAKGLLIS
jgi:hypothetical protein